MSQSIPPTSEKNKVLWSAYIHVPFCRERCTYCAFNTYIDRSHLIEAYVKAVTTELKFLTQSGITLHTIYFGGGTPSLLSPHQLDTILQAGHRYFDVTPDLEITLEANPATVDKNYLTAIYHLGINRLSLGMQSTHQQELTLFGRLHHHPDVIQAVETARAVGFSNLSLDLIYGVPTQTRDLWKKSLEAALALHPDHLSLYALGLEAGTEMKRQVTYGELPAPDSDLAADMYDDATECLDKAGFMQYEISNWARGNKACQHNLQYWRNLPYLGIGAGAHGYTYQADGLPIRTINALKPELYIQHLEAQQAPLAFPRTNATIKADLLDLATDMFETVFMGLRLLDEGFSLNAFAERYGERFEVRFRREINHLQALGLLRQHDDRLWLTSSARLLSNRVFAEFAEETNGNE